MDRISSSILSIRWSQKSRFFAVVAQSLIVCACLSIFLSSSLLADISMDISAHHHRSIDSREQGVCPVAAGIIWGKPQNDEAEGCCRTAPAALLGLPIGNLDTLEVRSVSQFQSIISVR